MSRKAHPLQDSISNSQRQAGHYQGAGNNYGLPGPNLPRTLNGYQQSLTPTIGQSVIIGTCNSISYRQHKSTWTENTKQKSHEYKPEITHLQEWTKTSSKHPCPLTKLLSFQKWFNLPSRICNDSGVSIYGQGCIVGNSKTKNTFQLHLQHKPHVISQN